MDFFSHGLWAGAIAKATNIRQRRANAWLAAFWGVFPDLFAFSIPFLWMFWQLLNGHEWPFSGPPDAEPIRQSLPPIFQYVSILYSISHSLVICLFAFGLMSLTAHLRHKRLPWEMSGWLLHILIDIPTHSYQFYPTPFLWPISSFTIDGFSWGKPWFIAVNYLALISVYIILHVLKRRILVRPLVK